MKDIQGFARGLGAGIFLISAFAAATALWKPDAVANLLERDARQTRSRRLQRAQRLAQRSPDYLDQCRAAGL